MSLVGESGNGSYSPAPFHPVPLWLQQTQGTPSSPNATYFSDRTSQTAGLCAFVPSSWNEEAALFGETFYDPAHSMVLTIL